MIVTARKQQSNKKNKSGDLLQQAMESFETALSVGMQLHEESVQRCVEILRDVGSPLEWDQTLPVKVNDAILAVQENIDRSIRFMNDNAQRTVSLMTTALEMHRTNPEASEEDHDFWIHALSAMQVNEQIVRQANTRVAESWRKLTEEASQRADIMA